MVLLTSTVGDTLLEIFVLLAFAELARSALGRYNVPEIVSYLLVGMLFGTYALGGVLNSIIGAQLFVVTPYVILFADFSIILVIFGAGLEGGIGSIRASGGLAVVAAVAGDLGTFAIALYVFHFFFAWDVTLLIAVAAASTSTAVVASLLRAERMVSSQGGAFLLSATAVDDVVGLILLSVILTILGGNSGVVAITGDIVLAVAAWIVLVAAALLIVPRVIRLIGPQESNNLPFLFLFIMIVIVSAFGFSTIIGAFIAGLAIAESTLAGRTRQILEVLIAIFGALFFAVLGAQFDVRLLLQPTVVIFALLLVAIAAGAKFLAVFPFARRRFRAPYESEMIAAGMIPRGEIGLVVGALGVDLSIFDGQELGIVLLMAIGTTLVGSLLFRRFVRLARQSADEANGTVVPGPA